MVIAKIPRRLFRGLVTARRRNRPPRRGRPGLESLEDRITPTILFGPQFGAETVHDHGGEKLSHVPVYLIYWGSFWNSAGGALSTATVTGALANVLASPYLSGLS